MKKVLKWCQLTSVLSSITMSTTSFTLKLYNQRVFLFFFFFQERVESLRQSLPDFSSFGINLQQLRENVNEWDWDRFASEILPSAGQDLSGL